MAIGGKSISIAALVVASFALEAAALLAGASGAMLAAVLAVHAGLIVLALFLASRNPVRRQAERREELLETALDSGALAHIITDNFDGLVIFDEHGTVLTASHVAEALLTGGAPLAGRRGADILPPAVAATLQQITAAGRIMAPTEISLATLPAGSSGEERHIQYVVNLSEVEGQGGSGAQRIACLSFWDVTQRRRDEERLAFLATHDPLTGALTRLKLVEEIDAALATQAGRDAGVTVLLVDLGRFKFVNDTLGHSSGDLLLKQVVSRLKSLDIPHVARLGGDCFALAHPGPMLPSQIRALCSAILDRLSESYAIGDHRAVIGASIGLTGSGLSGYDPDTLLSHADMALSAAKAVPGNAYVMFSPDMDERLKEKQDMELALRNALAHNELTLSFQPQMLLETGEMIGVEALVRWIHPTLGAVSPDSFIPAAEETGLIIELGRFVLESACIELASWPEHVRLSVNVSPIQFELVDVVEEVRYALNLSGLPADRLDIEITEGIFLSKSTVVIESLEALRRMGVGIALDDFGTGYSSLSYLGRLPVDKIKIDKSFVRNLPNDPEASAIIRAVMTLSTTLGKVVIAEGIENADQARMLRKMGCTIGQGYHFSRPRSAAEMLQLLGEHGSGTRALAV